MAITQITLFAYKTRTSKIRTTVQQMRTEDSIEKICPSDGDECFYQLLKKMQEIFTILIRIIIFLFFLFFDSHGFTV